MSKPKYILQNWLPPAIVRLLRGYFSPGIYFEGNYASWEAAAANCTGYDAEEILEKVLASTLKVKHGEAAFERDSVLFNHIEYSWPIVAGLMWGAAQKHGNLNVLDFGGSLGSSYFQNHSFIQDLPGLRWNIIEQSHYVKAGKKHIQDKNLRFYETLEECFNENQPTVILLSGVLQYLSDPFSLLEHLLLSKPEILIIDRTAYLDGSKHPQIKIQNIPENIYQASYPCWFFLESDVVGIINDLGYTLMASFPSFDDLDKAATWKGHIFRKKY